MKVQVMKDIQEKALAGGRISDEEFLLLEKEAEGDCGG